MIKFRFKSMKNMERCHEALVGSPGYINSEIAIVKNELGGFDVVVGNVNGHDINIYWMDLE